MNADADDHGEKGVTFSGVDAHIMKMVIIEYPVIDPFAGSAVIINLFIFLRAAWNRRIKPDVPFRFGVDASAVSRGRAFRLAGAGIFFATGKGAAPFTGMFLPAVSPVGHTETGHAQRGAVSVNGDGAGDGIRASPVIIEVDKGAYLPVLAQPVSSIVVMGGVQADIPDGDIRVDGLEFPEGDDGADAVVPPGVQEMDMQGQVNAVF